MKTWNTKAWNENQLDTPDQIPAAAIDETKYFQSLMSYCGEWGLLDFQEIQGLFAALTEITVKQCLQYNGTDSSSIPLDLAKEIGEGVLYTVNYCLEMMGKPDKALAQLRELSLADVYRQGKSLLKALVNKTKQQYLAMLSHKPEIDSYTYNSTMQAGISGFLKLYDVEFMPHQNTATMDYPLAIGDLPLSGITFLNRYIQYIHYENEFITLFSPWELKSILTKYDPLYGENLTNMVDAVVAVVPEVRLEGFFAELSPNGRAYMARVVQKENIKGTAHKYGLRL